MEALDREILRRPRGTAARISKKLGKRRGWWYDRRRRHRPITVEQFEVIAEFLELDVPALACSAYGSDPGFHHPPGEPPALLEKAWQLALFQTQGHLDKSFIAEIDLTRHQNPEKAMEMIAWGLDGMSARHMPSLLGVAGSCSRQLFELGHAEHYLVGAITMARRLEQRSDQLLRRLSAVLQDAGRHQEACRVLRRAIVESLFADDSTEVVVGLLHQAVLWFDIGDYENSLVLLRRVHQDLPGADERRRFIARYMEASNLEALGRTSEALLAVDRAESLANGQFPSYLAKIDWLRARLLSATGQHQASIELFGSVQSYYLEHHVGEAALVTCDLARAFLDNGDLQSAIRCMSSLRSFIEPASKSTVVAEAIRRLLTTATLTFQLLESVRAALQSESRRPTWRRLSLR